MRATEPSCLDKIAGFNDADTLFVLRRIVFGQFGTNDVPAQRRVSLVLKISDILDCNAYSVLRICLLCYP